MVAGDVELERRLGEGAAIAQDELGVARVPDPRLEVTIQPLAWEVVAPRNERLAIRVLRKARRVSESRATPMAKQPKQSESAHVVKENTSRGRLSDAARG